ncbi:MAG: hypothetical protein IPK82_25195 [Polyangiaceae bacterium]|nr:hypothetical protein [Polyangiaceae bacterium]
MRWPPAKYWGWAGIVLLAMSIFHYKRTLGELDRMRAQLLSKQRVVKAEAEPKWMSLRDKLEGWTQSLAKAPTDDVIEKDALAGWTFRDKKGVYLRIRAEDAASPETLRKAAKDSLRDAFTACLAIAPNENPLAGHECKKSSDCARGEHCNEQDRCSKPAQPFNLRIAYRAFSVLNDDWVREVQEGSEMTIRAIDGTFDDLVKNDMPMAMDLVREAQYFLVVIDEKAENEPDPAPAGTVRPSSPAEARQALPHFARIGVWRLSDDKQILRLRREAAGQLLGQAGVLEPDVAEARQRQANSCSLAISVRQAIGDQNAASVPPTQ